MSIEARQIQETLYSYATILNFTPSPQGLRAKFGACSVQNAQLFFRYVCVSNLCPYQPRSQGLRGETVTKTLVKFVLSFQNFAEKSHAQ